MPIDSGLLVTIVDTLKISPMTLSRWARQLIRDHGPMSGDEARWIIAHEAGIDLRKHGLSPAQLDRVRELRRGIRSTRASAVERAPVGKGEEKRTRAASRAVTDWAPTPAAMFDLRPLHPAVVNTSRKLFLDGHRTEAIRKALQSVNNRVKKLSGVAKDGQALMAEAFRKTSPPLQMTGLANTSEQDEQEGVRFLMMGGMAALRNPATHEDQWEPGSDANSTLEALALASMLHRFLERCEAYRAANP